MSNNYVQPGDILDLTAPEGGVTSGVAVLIGDLLVIAVDTAEEGESFRGATRGVFSVTKTGSQAWAEGVPVYWDDEAKEFTTVSEGNYLAGNAIAVVGSGSGETTGLVRLSG